MFGARRPMGGFGFRPGRGFGFGGPFLLGAATATAFRPYPYYPYYPYPYYSYPYYY